MAAIFLQDSRDSYVVGENYQNKVTRIICEILWNLVVKNDILI